jgi:hypothetical protein
MIVTGVQPVGARGLGTVQVAAVDAKDVLRAGQGGDSDREAATTAAVKGADAQPVVFPRAGVGLDQRPVAMRRHQATERYKRDGENDEDDARKRRR